MPALVRRSGVRSPGARGFTLLELIAVVSIIAVFASLAIPSAVSQLRSRRVQEAARQIGLVYREARLRALGRGSAVLVRVNLATNQVTVHEATVGGTGVCANLPVSSCLTPTNWGNERVVGGVTLAGSSNTTLALTDSEENAVTALDICFSPMGRAFVRESINNAVAFAALTETYTAIVSRDGTRSRQVVLMPNGTARLN